MGFLEKLKNTFFEEEYVEVEEKERVKKEPKREPKKVEFKKRIEEKLPSKKEEVVEISPKEVVAEEKHEPVLESVKEPVKEPSLENKTLKRETSFGYFDDADFLDFTEELEEPVKPRKVENAPKKQEKAKLYDNPSYASTTTPSGPYSKDPKTGFKPTPIISPIYGILDKNYTKEEVPEKREVKPSSYVSRKHADLDSVREKAFGSLAGDFGLTATDPISEEKQEVPEVEDNLLYDMTSEDNTPAVEKVTLQDAEEYFQDLGLEYNIDYKDAKLEKATGRRVSKTPKIDEIEEESVQKEEKVPAETEQSENVENDSLEDNLFDLIDSMYEEKE